MGAIKRIIEWFRLWFLPEEREVVINENLTVPMGEVKNGTLVSYGTDLLDLSRVHYITGDCGCTKAYVEGKELVIKIDTTRVVHKAGEKTPHNKYVTLYYDKDEPYFIANDKKERIVNHKKKTSTVLISFVTTD